jgi:hypothetical protein
MPRVVREVFLAAPREGDDYNALLVALVLLHRDHSNPFDAVRLERFSNLRALLGVWRDYADVV